MSRIPHSLGTLVCRIRVLAKVREMELTARIKGTMKKHNTKPIIKLLF